MARRAIPDHQVSESSRRAEIIETIRRESGISTGRLRLLCGVSWGTLTYHLERLRAAGHVTIVTQGRHKHVFLADDVQPTPPAGDAVLSCAAARDIATAIMRAPGIGIVDAAGAAGVTHRMSYYHANALIRAGLVKPIARRKYHALFPSPALERMLRSYQAAVERLRGKRGSNELSDDGYAICPHDDGDDPALPSHG